MSSAGGGESELHDKPDTLGLVVDHSAKGKVAKAPAVSQSVSQKSHCLSDEGGAAGRRGMKNSEELLLI
jgi:hypothetical protein